MMSITATKPVKSIINKQSSGTNNRRCSTIIPRAALEDKHQGPKMALAAAAASLFLMSSTPAMAIDLNTFKAGTKATIEASDITKESAESVVKNLKDVVMPEVERKLNEAVQGKGSSYPESVVKELQTVKSEIAALDRQLAGGETSSIKSAASGIEQQINALKAILGFD